MMRNLNLRNIGTVAAIALALHLVLAGCGGKYDKPLEVYKEYQAGAYNYGAPLLGFDSGTHMAMTGGHFFMSYRDSGALLDYFANGVVNSGVEFEGLVSPTIVGEGLRAVAVVETAESLSVKVFRPGGGQPFLTFSDPDWRDIGGLAVDDDDNIYVSDTEQNFVRAYDATGAPRFEVDLADSGFGIGHVISPMGLHFDGEALLIAEADDDKAQVQRVSIHEPQQGIVFSETVPFLSFFTDSAGNDINLIRPVAVTTDTEGNIFVLDAELGRIFRYTFDGESDTPVQSSSIEDPEMMLDAVAIGTYRERVYAFERGTGTIHIWYSTE
jgi:hypothetical protein